MRAKKPTEVFPWIILAVDEKPFEAPFYRPSFFANT